jgi:hypothetical protein
MSKRLSCCYDSSTEEEDYYFQTCLSSGLSGHTSIPLHSLSVSLLDRSTVHLINTQFTEGNRYLEVPDHLVLRIYRRVS